MLTFLVILSHHLRRSALYPCSPFRASPKSLPLTSLAAPPLTSIESHPYGNHRGALLPRVLRAPRRGRSSPLFPHEPPLNSLLSLIYTLSCAFLHQECFTTPSSLDTSTLFLQIAGVSPSNSHSGTRRSNIRAQTFRRFHVRQVTCPEDVHPPYYWSNLFPPANWLRVTIP
jgi:hypothetical protein